MRNGVKFPFKDVVERQQLLTGVFQNLRLVYISCKYFTFEKNIPFSIFPGVIFLRVLIDKLGGLPILHTSPLTDYFLISRASRY